MKLIDSIILFSFIVLSGCNFESGNDSGGGGGLFNNNVAVTDTFNLSVPSSKTYITGQNLDFTLTHSSTLTITGTPQLQLTIGSATVYADYISGSGGSNIAFRYTVASGDNDSNGIDINPTINLNGGNIQFSSNGSLTTASTSITTVALTASINVDTLGPAITGITPPVPKIYYEGEQLDFLVLFDQAAVVIGSPQISLDLGGVSVTANYITGSGSISHIYRYTVTSSDLDSDGITMSSPLLLNGGSVKDSAGNISNLSFTPTPMLTTYVDGNSPYVVSLTIPTSKTYILNDLITFDLVFNEVVNISGGVPSVDLTVGAAVRQATYISGSGSNTLKFQYIIQSGEDDANGVVVGNSINLNGSTIQDITPLNARLDTNAPLSPGAIVDSGVASVIALTPPVDADYITGTDLDFILQFDKPVAVTNTPRLNIVLATGTAYANYVSGTGTDTLVYKYTVMAPDIDNDGILFGTNLIDLNTTGIITHATYTTVNASLDFTSFVPSDMSAITLNKTPGTQLAITTQPSNSYKDFTMAPAITVEVRDISNSLVIAANNNVTLSFATDPSAGVAILAGTLTVPAVGGIATFSDLSIDTLNAGYTFTASSPSLTSATSLSFDITAAPASKLAFIQNPGNSIAGVNMAPSITVEIQDSAGNLITTATDTVSLTLGTDPSAGVALLGGTLSIAAVGGVATFSNLNLDKAFTGYDLTAASGILTSTTSASFNISPNIKSQLAFSAGPSVANENSAIAPAIVVEIQDAFGNKTTDTDSIVLAINNNPAAGALAGTLTVPAIAGAASFNDITIDKGGVGYTLDATSGALTLVTSSAFDINVVPTQIIITQEPSSAANGFNIAPAITVELRDSLNNLVIGATDTVTVSIGTDPSAGSAVITGTLSAPAIGGIATFSDLNIDLVNIAYDLVFSSGSLTSATSIAFDITQAPATQLSIITQPTNAVAGVILSPAITIEVQDANGIIVPTATDSVILSFGTDASSGTATLAGTLSIAAINGVATFSDITVDKAFNAYTLFATSGALSSSTSSAFNISPGVKSKLAFTTEPSATDYGVNIAPIMIVEIQDAYGNKTPDTDSITLAINNNPSTGIIAGTLTQPAIAGSANFNDISIDKVGIGYTLDATASGLTLATSTAFAITATPTQIIITGEPSSGYTGVPIAPAITAELRDINNNLVLSATDSVSINLGTDPSAGAAVIGGTTSVAAVGGIVSFNDITIDSANTGYTFSLISGALTSATSISFDMANLSITSIIAPIDATYVTSNNLDFIINTSEVIDVVGVPRIAVDIGGVSKFATYFSGTGTSALTFRYVVEPGLTDIDGIVATSPLDLNAGTIKNAALTNLNLIFTPPTMALVLVDSVVPLITSITPPADTTYIETNNLDFTVNIDSVVNISGIPRIAVDIGGVSKFANYLSGTGTNTLIFRYVIEVGLTDIDGVVISSPLDLNTGTIQDAGIKNLDLNFTAPTMPLVLVDSLVPTVAITSPVTAGYINIANNSTTYTISGTCDENGQTVAILVDSVVATSPVDFLCNGVSFTGTIDVTALTEGAHTLDASLADLATNTGVSVTVNLTKDTIAPVITSVAPPIANYYIAGANLDFILNLDEITNVAGTRIQIDIGGVVKYANFISGTGTNAITYRYTITAGDNDLNGLGFASSIVDLNAGTIADNAGNQINLNLDASVALPSLASIFVDTTVPIVAITSALPITAANELTYSVTGTCSEEGRIISVNLGGIVVTPACSTGAWTTGAVDVSSVGDNPAFPISADHTDIAGNSAVQASLTVDKNSATPQVAITLAQDITSANATGYPVSGTCTENGTIITVVIGGSITVTPNCSSGAWTTGNIDVSALADNISVPITADHSTAVQASVNVLKDTASPIVVISSAPNISLTNQTSYIASGTCSQGTIVVTVNIGILNFTPTCTTGSWPTGSIDVSTLADGASILVTADHSTAPQASLTISKNTLSPTVASLSVPTTLSTSADLGWTLNDPGGFTINDGINTNTTSTVTGLLASTYYEFRVRVQYNTSTYSDWTNTATGQTKPNDPLFTSPYMAMNVGGSTDTKVVALYDNTRIYHNGVEIVGSPIAKGTPITIPGGTAQFDTIDADQPIYTAGRRGAFGAANASKANVVWNPTAWAGKTFSFNAIRGNPQQLYVYSTEATTITVKQGSTVLASTTIAAGVGTTLSWSVYGSYQVASTGTILAFHSSGNPASNAYEDPKPLLPSSLELIGVPSRSIRITSDLDSTNYSAIHGNDTTLTGSINKIQDITINGTGTSSLYQEDGLLVTSDRNISIASFADANGNCAAPFIPTSLMKKNYMINNSADWVSFVSKLPGTIDVQDSTGTVVQTLTLTRAGTATNSPYIARRGLTPTGYRFFATVPVGAWYQPDNDTGSADQDETILYGTNN